MRYQKCGLCRKTIPSFARELHDKGSLEGDRSEGYDDPVPDLLRPLTVE